MSKLIMRHHLTRLSYRKRKSEDAASLPSSSSASSLASLASSPITDASGKCVNCKQHLANVKHCPKLESSVRSEKEALGHPNIAIEGFASTEEKPQVHVNESVKSRHLCLPLFDTGLEVGKLTALTFNLYLDFLPLANI